MNTTTRGVEDYENCQGQKSNNKYNNRKMLTRGE